MQPESHSVRSEIGVMAGCQRQAMKYTPNPKIEASADVGPLTLIEN